MSDEHRPHLVRLGQWIASLDAASIPETTRHAARLQVLNMIAAAHAGGQSQDVLAVVAGVASFAGPGKATVLTTGERWTPADALMVNAACSMAQDFDDIVWMGHTCHSAVFASLGVAEHEESSASDMITAVVIGNEIGGRLGASTLLGPLNGQMWTFLHLVTAAAATARLLRLNAEQATHALAIALAQPTFALQPGFLAPSSKLLAASVPAVTGMQAAYLARAGVTGAPEILEDRRGFWRRFAYLPLPFMLEGLGEIWTMDTLQVKTFPGCHYFQTACTALEALVTRLGPFQKEDVRQVRIETTKLGAEASRFGGEYACGANVTAVNACFDLATAAAILLTAGRLTGQEMDPDWLRHHSPEIIRWRDRIEVKHDPELTARMIASTQALPAGRAFLHAVGARDLIALRRRYRQEYRSNLLSAAEASGWLRVVGNHLLSWRPGRAFSQPLGPVALSFPNRVTLEFVDGRTEVETRDVPSGCFALPEMGQALETKFLREVGLSLGADRARKAFSSGTHIESASLADFVVSVTANK